MDYTGNYRQPSRKLRNTFKIKDPLDLLDKKDEKRKTKNKHEKKSIEERIDDIVKGMPGKTATLPILIHYYEQYKQNVTSDIGNSLFPCFKKADPIVIKWLDAFLEKYKQLSKSQKERFVAPELLDIDSKDILKPDLLKKVLLKEISENIKYYDLDNTRDPLNACTPGKVRPFHTDAYTEFFPEGDYLDPTIWYINDQPQSEITPAPRRWKDEHLSIKTVRLSSDHTDFEVLSYHTSDCIAGSTGIHGNPPNTCLKVPALYHDRDVILKGMNFFDCQMEVILYDKQNRNEIMVIKGTLTGDLEAPPTARNASVQDTFRFTLPARDQYGYEIVGEYFLQVRLPNPDASRYHDINGTLSPVITSRLYAVHVAPPPNISYRVSVEKINCSKETYGWGSDHLGLSILTRYIPHNSDDAQPPIVQFKQDDVDSGDTFNLTEFLKIHSGPMPLISIATIRGYEIDVESAYDRELHTFEQNFVAFWEEFWDLLSGLALLVGGVAFFATDILISSIIVGGILALGAIVGVIYALIAGPDLVISEILAIPSDHMYFLTSMETALPGSYRAGNFEGIHVTVQPQSKNIDGYVEKRTYISDDQQSIYRLEIRYKRLT